MIQPTRAFTNFINIKLTFNENPTSTAPHQIQIGQLVNGDFGRGSS
jgi:hypothetical protein